MKRVLQLNFVPASIDLGLLLLRVWAGSSLLLLHGWAKLTGYSKMMSSFSDPLGVGSQLSLTLAILGEAVCSTLLVLGLFSRLAALGCAITMGVAFTMIHGFVLRGPGSGEMAYLYLGIFLTLFLAGPGRFSLDARFGAKART
jgi:putative oxidoreductase